MLLMSERVVALMGSHLWSSVAFEIVKVLFCGGGQQWYVVVADYEEHTSSQIGTTSPRIALQVCASAGVAHAGPLVVRVSCESGWNARKCTYRTTILSGRATTRE